MKDHVQEDEIDKLLSKPDPLSNKSKKKEANALKDAERLEKLSRLKAKQRSGSSHGNLPPLPSPDQMRQNAAMIRKNPALVKKSNPQFAKMSNEELMQMADQMEKMAEDPDMYKQVSEQVNSMTPQERADIAKMQKDGTLPKAPLGGSAADAVPQESQIASMAKMLKTNPVLFKKMMKQQGGMFANQTDEQIDSYIQQLSQMDEKQLKQIFTTGTWLQQYAGPAKEMYDKVDKATYGCARYILGIIVLIIGYYCVIFGWYVLKNVFSMLRYLFYLVTGVSAGSKAAAGVADSAADIAKTAISDTAKVAEDIPAATGDEFEF